MHFFNRRTSQAAKKPARTEGYGLQPVHKWLRINRALQAAGKRPPWRFVTVIHWLRRPARNETNVLRFVFVLFNLQRFWTEGAGAFRLLNAALIGAAFRPGPCGVTVLLAPAGCPSGQFPGNFFPQPVNPRPFKANKSRRLSGSARRDPSLTIRRGGIHLSFAFKDEGEDRVLAGACGGAQPGVDAAWAVTSACGPSRLGCVPVNGAAAQGGRVQPRTGHAAAIRR